MLLTIKDKRTYKKAKKILTKKGKKNKKLNQKNYKNFYKSYFIT